MQDAHMWSLKIILDIIFRRTSKCEGNSIIGDLNVKKKKKKLNCETQEILKINSINFPYTDILTAFWMEKLKRGQENCVKDLNAQQN